MTVITCPKCGAGASPWAARCPACGTDVTTVPVAVAPETAPSAAAAETAPPAAAESVPPTNCWPPVDPMPNALGSQGQPRRRRRFEVFAGLVVAVLVAVVVTVVVVAVRGGDGEDDGASAGLRPLTERPVARWTVPFGAVAAQSFGLDDRNLYALLPSTFDDAGVVEQAATVVAYDAVTGGERWRTPLAGEPAGALTVTATGPVVLEIDDAGRTRLVAHDRDTGAQRWVLDATDGALWASSPGGALGVRVRRADGAVATGLVDAASGVITSSVLGGVVGGGTGFVLVRDGARVTRYDLSTLVPGASWTSGQAPDSAAVVGRGVLVGYVAGSPATLTGVTTTGTTWELPLEWGGRGVVQSVDDRHVLVSRSDRAAYVEVGPDGGTVRWTADLVVIRPLTADTVVASVDDRPWLVRLTDDGPQRVAEVGTWTGFSGLYAPTGAVVYGRTDTALVAYRPDGEPRWAVQLGPQAVVEAVDAGVAVVDRGRLTLYAAG